MEIYVLNEIQEMASLSVVKMIKSSNKRSMHVQMIDSSNCSSSNADPPTSHFYLKYYKRRPVGLLGPNLNPYQYVGLHS